MLRAMCSVFLFALFLSCAGSSSRADGAGGRRSVFDINSVPEVVVRISEKEWNSLLASIDRDKANVPYVKADFEFLKEGRREKVRSVGFRIRGGAFSRVRPEVSRRHKADSGHFTQAHFKVNFSRFKKGRRFHSLRSINFKMFNGDPALVREVFAMDLMRRFGIRVAHYSTYVRLKIHILSDSKPVSFGIYRMNEVVDSTFIADRFPGDKNGNLWKCLWPGDLKASTIASGRASLGLRKTGVRRPTYELKTGKDRIKTAGARFLTFMKNVEQLDGERFKKWILHSLDVDLFLKTMAAGLLLGSWDDYRFNSNNFYFYLPASGRAVFIPYDFDNVLGTATFDVGRVSIWSVSDARPLVKKILSVSEFRSRYAGYVRKLLASSAAFMHPASAKKRIRYFHFLILPWLENDLGQRNRIADLPGSWSRVSGYRLLEAGKGENFFQVRALAALQQLKDSNLVQHRPERRPVQKIKKKEAVDKSGYRHQYPGMGLRGYFNHWGFTPLKLVADYTWEGVFLSPALSKYGFKLATGPNWGRDLDWGELQPKNDGVADLNTGSGRHIKYPGAGRYRVRFHSRTLRYSVVRIR